MRDQPDNASDDGPWPLRLAVLLIWLEAAGLAIVSIVELIKVITNTPSNPGLAVILGLLIAGVAFLLVKAAAALTYRRAWARSISIVIQLMALPVAWFMATGAGGPITKTSGILLGLLAGFCASLLLTPSSQKAFFR